MPADSPERTARTRKFQQINDAYYTLSDPTRRRDYDATRRYHGFGSGFGPGFGSSSNTPPGGYGDPEEEIPRPEPGNQQGGGFSFPWSAFGFGGQAKNEEDANKFSSEQFGNVFEEMLRYATLPFLYTHCSVPDFYPGSKVWPRARTTLPQADSGP